MPRPPPRLDDLVIVLPGITGSALTVNGKDVWAASGESIWGAIKTRGHILEDLTLDFDQDDPERAHLADGVRADRLIDNVSLLPGITAVTGYNEIVEMITSRFRVRHGEVGDPTPANFYTFPYDWRRDNRSSAQRLKEFIDDRLPAWRSLVGSNEPEVILLAHSMGGLVARHYLEMLGGAEHAKALFTFGTPFRGAPKALGGLSHGIKKAWLDLTPMLRSFTSIHQLLPIYEMLDTASGPRRLAEVNELPGLDPSRVANALAFHRDIETAVEANGTGRYLTLPYVGFRQRTTQSARFLDNELVMSNDAPAWFDQRLAGGDGTVPLVSAIPIELSDASRETYAYDKHGAMQSSNGVLDQVHRHLLKMSAKGLAGIRGQVFGPEVESAPAVGVAVDPLFEEGEPVVVIADLFNIAAEVVPKSIVRRAAATSGTESVMHRDSDGWKVDLEGLTAGVYRLEVRAGTAAAHDVFEVLP